MQMHALRIDFTCIFDNILQQKKIPFSPQKSCFQRAFRVGFSVTFFISLRRYIIKTWRALDKIDQGVRRGLFGVFFFTSTQIAMHWPP